MPALFVGLAADDPFQPPARFGLATVDRVDIGRADRRQCKRSNGVLTLSLQDARLSSQHARIARIGAAWVLEDLGSKNGTWVEAQRVRRHPLVDGDAIVVGHSVLVFRSHGGDVPDLEQLPAAPRGLATLSASLAHRLADTIVAASSLVPIEITGETGTGKELVARAVHQSSQRPGRFVAVNCGALTANLIEAELFGHKKGAFTGAGEERTGLIRSADGGTLFLDEVGELPASAQTSLLRVLQEREVTPIGSDRTIKVDVRIVTATHRNLDADVSANQFRPDLRARLLGVQIELPPLRDRREDLGHLVSTLLAQLAPGRKVAFSVEATSALYAHSWPLNIRELERSLAAALAVSRDRIELEHLPTALRTATTPWTAPSSPIVAPIRAGLPEDDDALRGLLEAAIDRHAGNLAAVARELGKDRTQIRRWMKRFGMARADDDP